MLLPDILSNTAYRNFNRSFSVQAAGSTDLLGPGKPPGQPSHADDAEDADADTPAVSSMPAEYTATVATRSGTECSSAQLLPLLDAIALMSDGYADVCGPQSCCFLLPHIDQICVGRCAWIRSQPRLLSRGVYLVLCLMWPMRWTTQERGGAARLSHELAAGAVRVLRVGGAGGTRPTGRRHRRLRLHRVARRCRRLLPHRHAEAH